MQRLLFIAFVTVTLALAPGRAALADELFRGPNPNWVEVADVPVASDTMRAAATGGALILLADEQVDWDGEEKQTYARRATLVTDSAGLEAAGRLELVYAPGHETLTLTRLAVIRGDAVIDLTDSAAATIQPQEPLVQGAPGTGNLTAVVQVPDLRVGDVVDYSYMRRTLPVVDGANRSGEARLEFDVPVVFSRVIVHWPESWPIYISGWPSRVAFTQTPGEGVIRNVWTRENHVPVPPEPAVPAGYSDNTVIAYSAHPDWREIAEALSPHYLQSYPLGAAWDARLRDIQTAETDPGRRAIAALRAVQDELGTVSLPLDAGRLLARSPEEVTRTGAGDSAEKALLLRTMLDKMGIEAYVALTDRDEGHALAQRKPSLQVFDHAIVKVVIDDVSYFMDPTASHEGGDLFSAVHPDFGHALPLSGPDQQQLEPIFATSGASSYVSVDETYQFSLLGIYLTVTSTHFGPAANAYRARLATSSPEEIQAGSLETRAARLPGLRSLRPMDVVDDKDYNQITVTETYLLPITALTGAGQAGLTFAPDDYVAHIPGPGGAPRVAPLDLGELRTIYYRVNLLDAPADLAVPESVNIYNDGFGYYFSGFLLDAGDLTLEWNYTQYLRTVPAAAVAQVQSDAEVVRESAAISLDLRP